MKASFAEEGVGADGTKKGNTLPGRASQSDEELPD